MVRGLERDHLALRVVGGERLYESSRAVNNGWRFTARTKSVNSIESGPIFVPALGQELSRNAFVVSILLF